MWAVDANGVNSGDWETGLATYGPVNTITRAVTRSSNDDAPVNFTGGTIYAAMVDVSAYAAYLDDVKAMPLPPATAEPAVPVSGLMLYAREIVPGHTVLKTMRPSGVDSPVQDAVAFNTSKKWQGNGTVMVAQGAAILTVSAAGTAVTPSSGSTKNQSERIQYATAATANALHTIVSPSEGNAFIFRGNVGGEGGGRKNFRFALNSLQAGARGFWGIAASRTAATDVDPTTVVAPARIGLAISTNTGNWFLVNSDGSTAPDALDLGANFPVDTTSLMELTLFVRPHNGTSAGNWGYRIRRYTTNSNGPAFEVTGTLSAKIPAATTLLHPWMFLRTGAAAAASNWHFCNSALDKDW